MTGLFSAAPRRQTLRDYQLAARDRLRELVAAKILRVLLVAPTGSGKTTIAAEIIHGAVSRAGSVLFLAHRKELIDQCSARLDGVGVDHGVIQAQHRRVAPSCPVQIASIPTLVKRLDRLPRATLVIVDEAHHARAGTYSAILDRYPGVPVIGLTATPWRLDNKGLGELFQETVVASTPRELIAAGHLVPFTGFAYDVPSLGAVKKTGADYNQRGLEMVMGRGALAGNIVEQWLAHCAGKRTVVFAVTVAHSKDLVERFRAAGVRAEHVDGTTPAPLRASTLARLRDGSIDVVSNVNVLTEGWDLPELEVCVLARPTLSVGLYLQMVGRVMRPTATKTLARIHDHAGCILRHGLPDDDRSYDLTGDAKKRADRFKLPPIRTCRECFAVYPAARATCPLCGCGNPAAVRAAVKEIHEATAIPIEQLRNDPFREHNERVEFLDRHLKIAVETKRKPSWAAYRFKDRFGEWPPSAWWAQNKRPLSAERLREIDERLRARGLT